MLLNIRFILAFSIAAIAAHDAQSADTFEPAALPQGGGSIESLLELPDDLGTIDYKITCELDLTNTGDSLWTQCYGSGQELSDAIRDAVRDAHREARFIPAVIGGERTAVMMHTTTSISITPAATTIVVVPNDNADERRKIGYSSPQAYGPALNWRAVTPPTHPRNKRPQYDPTFVWITVYVSEMGTPWAYAIKEELKLQKWRREEIVAYVQQHRFIPAVEDGRPVPSIYKEVLDSRKHR
jgi:hypothetical protein